MTTITGEVYLPYGPGGRTGADGCVSFYRQSSSTEGGVITLPGSISAKVEGGVMEPVELSPGVWRVLVKTASISHAMGAFEVAGETMRLMGAPAAERPPAPAHVEARGGGAYALASAAGTAAHLADGTYTITLTPPATLHDAGNGDYTIGDEHV